MKKLILFVAAFVLFGLASASAQGVAPAAKQATTHVTKKGTPDRRFKENKTTAAHSAAAVKTRADGQPDMRYKANKEAAAAKSAANASAVRKSRAKSVAPVR